MRCDLRHDLVEDSDTPTRALIPFRVCRMEVYVYGEGSCAFEVAMFWMPHVLVLFPRIDVVTSHPALLCLPWTCAAMSRASFLVAQTRRPLVAHGPWRCCAGFR